MSQDQTVRKKSFKRALTLEEISSNVLNDISITLKKGEHLTIVGKIGSGKTSLLFSLMDETVHKSGKHQIKGRVAYVE